MSTMVGGGLSNTEYRAYRRCQFQTNKPTKVDICERVCILIYGQDIDIYVYGLYDIQDGLGGPSPPPPTTVHFEQHIKKWE